VSLAAIVFPGAEVHFPDPGPFRKRDSAICGFGGSA